MNKNLDQRRDNRTIEQFKEDIYYRTKKEKFLIELFKREYKYRGITVKVKNYGIDNTGKLTKVADCRPDYKVVFDNNEYLVEVKNSPVSDKWTFKTYNLKQYVKQNANILIFWGTGYIDKEPKGIDYEDCRFGLILTNKIQLMLDLYEPYNEPAFGNKECIRVYEKNFTKLVNIQKLTCNGDIND